MTHLQTLQLQLNQLEALLNEGDSQELINACKRIKIIIRQEEMHEKMVSSTINQFDQLIKSYFGPLPTPTPEPTPTPTTTDINNHSNMKIYRK